MRVALVDCTYRLDGKLIRLKRIGYFPATLPVLAAAVPEGHDVSLHYEKCRPVDVTVPYDVVFFTTMGPNLYRAMELSKEFRARGVKTVVGGWTVPPFPDECQEHFDAIVLGEGEHVLPRILDDVKNGRLERRYENFEPDLSDIRVPRFELLDPAIVGGVVPIEASRGCSHSCDFCAVAAVTKRRFRPLPIDAVVRSIEHAKKVLGRPLYYFTDPNFALDPKRAMALLARIKPLGITWQANVDARALANEEFVLAAREAGCFTLQVGIETPDKDELKRINKGFASQLDYEALIQRTHALGVPVTALMMLGYKSDTPATFDRVQRFVERNRIPILILHVLTPVPGTRYYDQCVADGRLLEEPRERADGLHLHVRPRNFSPEEFGQRFKRLVGRVTSPRSVLRRSLHLGVFKNFKAHLILLVTNLFVIPKPLRMGYPPGMYE